MEARIAECVNVFARSFFLDKTKVFNKLRHRYRNTQQEQLLELRNTYMYHGTGHFLKYIEGQLVFLGDKSEARAIAEILCPLGYMFMVEEKENVVGMYASKIRTTPLYHPCPMPYIHIYISSKFLTTNMIGSTTYVPNKLMALPSPYTKKEFLKYIRWETRIPAFLVASRYRNGNFFHVLKMIAEFL